MSGMKGEEGSKFLVVKDNDTDLLVISVLPVPQKIGLQQLWVAFGQGKNLRWIPVHDLHHSTGLEKSKGILFFHASTGCDVYQDSVVEGRSQHGKPGMSRGF